MKLKWRSEKPTREGWYWCRREGYDDQIRKFEPGVLSNGGIEPVDGPLSTAGWRYLAGPIERPEE